MKEYLLFVLFISFVFLYSPITQFAEASRGMEPDSISNPQKHLLFNLYTSQNSFRKKPKTILSEYNCNQDLVFEKTKNQTGFSIYPHITPVSAL